MGIKRRRFLRLTAGGASLGASIVSGLSSFAAGTASDRAEKGLRFSGMTEGLGSGAAEGLAAGMTEGLSSMTGDVAPISQQERQLRIEKAQRLMTDNKISALLLD